MIISLDYHDIARIMQSGESFRWYHAAVAATHPDRIDNLWQQISSQINGHSQQASNCCFLLRAPEAQEATMMEIATLCDRIRTFFPGQVTWGYDTAPDDRMVMELIG